MIPKYSASDSRVDPSQTREQDLVYSPVIKPSIETILSRSVLAAHLLVGDITEAENVVLEAINMWKPDDGDEEQLFQITLKAAVRRSAPCSLQTPFKTDLQKASFRLHCNAS